MVSTVYTNFQQPAIQAEWLNDVNAFVYGNPVLQPGGNARKLVSKSLDIVNVRDYGAICDGVSRPLSTLFSSLGAAQAVYPSAQALTDELDSVAIQKCFDAVAQFTTIQIRGTVVSNKRVFLQQSNITIDGTGAKWQCKGVSAYCLIFSAYINRNLNLTDQIMELPYEGAIIQTGITVFGLTVEPFTGSTDSCRMLFMFSDNLVIDQVTIKKSNVNGIELRQCSTVSIPRMHAEDCTFFGLFVYQSHNVRGGFLTYFRCFEGIDIKERHKLYICVDHSFERVICEDMTTNAGGWIAMGNGYMDLHAGEPGFYSPTAYINRNFPGHEIMRGISFGRVDLRVSDSASVSVTNPSFAIAIYSDRVRVEQINFLNNLKPFTNVPLAVGIGGDLAQSVTYPGATFGANHIIGCVSFNDYALPVGRSLIVYGGNGAILAGTYTNVRTGRVIEQAAAAQTPLGFIDSFEFRNQVGTITLPLSITGSQGVRILAETRKFISGGNVLSFIPVNDAASTNCNPWNIQATEYLTVATDTITVQNGGVGASNHLSTAAMVINSSSGVLDAAVTVVASSTATNTQAISVGTASTRGLQIQPCVFTLTGAALGTATAFTLQGESTNLGGHQFSGSWTTQVVDANNSKNTQNLLRVVYAGAAPTSGTWDRGDIVRNAFPLTSSPVLTWRCAVAGTPGTWVADSWWTVKSTTANRPVLLASGVGVQYLDTTLAAAGKPIMWTGTQWVDATGAVV